MRTKQSAGKNKHLGQSVSPFNTIVKSSAIDRTASLKMQTKRLEKSKDLETLASIMQTLHLN